MSATRWRRLPDGDGRGGEGIVSRTCLAVVGLVAVLLGGCYFEVGLNDPSAAAPCADGRPQLPDGGLPDEGGIPASPVPWRDSPDGSPFQEAYLSSGVWTTEFGSHTLTFQLGSERCITRLAEAQGNVRPMWILPRDGGPFADIEILPVTGRFIDEERWPATGLTEDPAEWVRSVEELKVVDDETVDLGPTQATHLTLEAPDDVQGEQVGEEQLPDGETRKAVFLMSADMPDGGYAALRVPEGATNHLWLLELGSQTIAIAANATPGEETPDDGAIHIVSTMQIRPG